MTAPGGPAPAACANCLRGMTLTAGPSAHSAQSRGRAFAEIVLVVAGELALVGVTNGSGDFTDSAAMQLRFQQAAAGTQQPHALEVFPRARATMLLEAVIERPRAHASRSGEIVDVDRLHVMLGDELFGAAHVIRRNLRTVGNGAAVMVSQASQQKKRQYPLDMDRSSGIRQGRMLAAQIMDDGL